MVSLRPDLVQTLLPEREREIVRLRFYERMSQSEIADVVVTGVPFDSATSNRPGTRFGPRAIREASTQLSDLPTFPYGFDLFEHLAIADYGDCFVDYGFPGKIIEAGRTREIINDPQHPYTQGLINALPQQTKPGMRLKQITGNMPSLTAIPAGCPFSPRCEYVRDHCRTTRPEPVQYAHVEVACHEVNRLHRENSEEQSA